ncbi:MAG: carboxypeptidase regulatory-like domain-containing protein [Acidobacteriota bacterium]
MRVVRIRLGTILSGIDPEQKEIEIATGLGGGDCGYPFQNGQDYVVYAGQNGTGGLETGLCSRTRPLKDAREDMEYFAAMANAPATSELRVLTAYPGTPAKPGVTIVAEREGSRYRAFTDASGDARFTGLAPGEYTLHAEAMGTCRRTRRFSCMPGVAGM